MTLHLSRWDLADFIDITLHGGTPSLRRVMTYTLARARSWSRRPECKWQLEAHGRPGAS